MTKSKAKTPKQPYQPTEREQAAIDANTALRREKLDPPPITVSTAPEAAIG